MGLITLANEKWFELTVIDLARLDHVKHNSKHASTTFYLVRAPTPRRSVIEDLPFKDNHWRWRYFYFEVNELSVGSYVRVFGRSMRILLLSWALFSHRCLTIVWLLYSHTMFIWFTAKLGTPAANQIFNDKIAELQTGRCDWYSFKPSWFFTLGLWASSSWIRSPTSW